MYTPIAALALVLAGSSADAFTPRASTFGVGSAAVSSRTTSSRGGALFAKEGQAEVVLVGCGAPNRGMGWWHAIQMLEDK